MQRKQKKNGFFTDSKGGSTPIKMTQNNFVAKIKKEKRYEINENDERNNRSNCSDIMGLERARSGSKKKQINNL